MNIVELQQGSKEWHEHRRNYLNASDAPAMMGCSPYKSRDKLLAEMATGITEEVDSATQHRFDKGHEFEALARPLAEEYIGEELYPVTGTNGRYSASLDGMTMDESIIFEHKTLNDDIRPCTTAAELPLHYRVQMEHQLMVSEAKMCLFTASKWSDDEVCLESIHLWYKPDNDLRQRIVAGWDQFEKDRAAYVPVAVIEKPMAEVTMDLPALFVQARGEITSSNMKEFGEALKASLANVRSLALVTDQDFSNAEAAAKKYRETCKKLVLAKEAMLEQTLTIGEAARMIDAWHEDLRVTALKLEKDVEKEKDVKKLAIVNSAKADYAEYITIVEENIKPIKLNIPQPDFAGAMKGKRLVSAWVDAVNTALANAKITATMLAEDVRSKLAWCKENADGYGFLFSDLQQVIYKPMEDFQMLVKSRVDTHKKAEEKKLEEEREQIRKEEAAKLEQKPEPAEIEFTEECRTPVASKTPALLTAQERIAITLQMRVCGLSATHADAVSALIVSNQIPGVVFSAVYGD